jgi:hypothetical protein
MAAEREPGSATDEDGCRTRGEQDGASTPAQRTGALWYPCGSRKLLGRLRDSDARDVGAATAGQAHRRPALACMTHENHVDAI